MTSISKKQLYLALGILGFTLSVTAYCYARLPQFVPSHWNYLGEVDATSPKLFSTLFIPGLVVLLLALFSIVPRFPRSRMNFDAIRETYSNFVVSLVTFFCLVQGVILSAGFGVRLDMSRLFPLLFGGLFVMIGLMIRKAPRNMILGFRTPWTLADDTVWEKTHTLGGKLFAWGGVVIACGCLFPREAFFFLVGTLLPIIVFIYVYSWRVAKEEKRKTGA